MRLCDVRVQLEQVIGRTIEAGLSVKQFHPSCALKGDRWRIGDLSSTIALKNHRYSVIYAELETNDQYHIKLPDGGLISFQYTFDKKEESLERHRLCFFPSPKLPTMEEFPELYDDGVSYADLISERLVRFPVRFDFDPSSAVDTVHPSCHMTLGQFENCRIPVSHPVAPNTFLLFVLRNFYWNAFRRRMNIFSRRLQRCGPSMTISDRERQIPHLVMWAKPE